MRAEHIMVSFTVVVVKSGRIHSCKSLSTTYGLLISKDRGELINRVRTYILVELVSHLVCKRTEIHSVPCTDRMDN